MFGDISPKLPGVTNQNAVNNQNGILSYQHGGTGLSSLTANGLFYAVNSSSYAFITPAANSVLITNGSNVPSLSTTLPSAVQGNITTVGTVTSGTWNAGIIPLAYGGTNANLTASNGGIFYSTGTAGAILAGTSTANQIILSGANSAPSWSTLTIPSTLASGAMLYASSANTLAALTLGTGLTISAGALTATGSSTSTDYVSYTYFGGV